MPRKITRRRFLQTSGALGLAAGLPVPLRTRSPSEKLGIAVVGAGGRGHGLVREMRNENIVALCDVDEKRAAAAFKMFPSAARYHDFRVMLDREEKNLDAVVVATCDHMHAPIAVNAMRRGLHCYCEKPLTWSIHEARVMTEVAKKAKVATQMGNQGSAHPGFRRGVEMLQAGVLGKVHTLHVWTNRPVWPQAIPRPEPKVPVPVPRHVKWELWLGVAPKRPYDPAYLPFRWRGWYDFGTGALGDMACHTVNLAWRGLELGPPETVEAKTTRLFDETYPAGARITYRFPARGNHPPLTFTWYEGAMRPGEDLMPQELSGGKLPGSGLLAVGEKGMMFSPDDYGTRQTYLPPELASFDAARTLPRTSAHHLEWIEACKGGPRAFSDFSMAGPFTETVLLGNLAIRTAKKIHWDAAGLKARGVPEADHLIRRRYPEGYAL